MKCDSYVSDQDWISGRYASPFSGLGSLIEGSHDGDCIPATNDRFWPTAALCEGQLRVECCLSPMATIDPKSTPGDSGASLAIA